MTTKQKIYEVTKVSLAVLESQPPKLAITAAGNCSTSGWKNFAIEPRVYIVPPADGIWDADLVADKPVGTVLEVITPMQVEVVWPSIPAELLGVRINAASNSQVAMLI